MAGAFTDLSPLYPQATAYTCPPKNSVTPGGRAHSTCGGNQRLPRGEQSLYQTPSAAFKRQSGGPPKIRRSNQKIFCRAKPMYPVRPTPSGRPFLRRRSRIAFFETIEQHFRHTQISCPFLANASAEPHAMGIGAIAPRAIAVPPTGMTLGGARGTLCGRRRLVGPPACQKSLSDGESATASMQCRPVALTLRGMGAIESPLSPGRHGRLPGDYQDFS